MTKHTPRTIKTPVRVEFTRGYATVYEADGNVIPELCDIELGWIDTSTGNYHSPEEAKDRIREIIKALNCHIDLLEALKEARRGLSPFQMKTESGIMIDKAIAKAEGK